MIKLLIRLVINALILMLIPYLISGISVSNFTAALVSALILALVNAIIKPILMVLTLPVNLLTLGLFTLVINGLLFWFVGSVIKGFEIAGFWPAFWAALVYSIASMLVNSLFGSKSEK